MIVDELVELRCRPGPLRKSIRFDCWFVRINVVDAARFDNSIRYFGILVDHAAAFLDRRSAL
jgi:hypothetical protein